MIVITGGAGFIGSCVQAALQRKGLKTAIVDWLGLEGKWKNLAGHEPEHFVLPEEMESFLAAHQKEIEAIIHMGAISETTAQDGDLVFKTNVRLSQVLWQWCARFQKKFIYASSAATYGGAFRDEEFADGLESLSTLHPLNLYGWSKHVFDTYVRQEVALGQIPSQWVGLKFFNVYGPNEYHKGKMISVIKVKYDEICRGISPRLFRSDREGLADGAQARDFIWVGDIVALIEWLLDHPEVNGLYNCGTGHARTYLDLAHAVCEAAGVPRKVEFIEMPEALKGQYQSYTCADMHRLRKAGYHAAFTSLEEGIQRYVTQYLAQGCKGF
ncbi:ADP-glyceromanno-heptose 6-epimerase [Entomobacter blattae]|nr:ADP-glyceromanno-heptose 6-epimerase [Entomobacter blattae]